MREIPVAVADTETIVRAVFHPFHLKGDKLKWQAFRPKAGRRDVSVMRHDFIGAEACRTRAKAMSDEDKAYRGFACLLVANVRTVGPDVLDSREQFMGHADIMHAEALVPAEVGEPPRSEVLEALTDICKRLAATAKYRADPDPAAVNWLGEALTA